MRALWLPASGSRPYNSKTSSQLDAQPAIVHLWRRARLRGAAHLLLCNDSLEGLHQLKLPCLNLRCSL